MVVVVVVVVDSGSAVVDLVEAASDCPCHRERELAVEDLVLVVAARFACVQFRFGHYRRLRQGRRNLRESAQPERR